MPQSLAQIYTHLIFSTKNRAACISPMIREDLGSYLAGFLFNLGSPAIAVNAVEDHVHLLYRQSKNLAMKQVVEEVKSSSSKWVKTQGDQYGGFYWQRGYGAFSVSATRVEAVKNYIQNQEEHHRNVGFRMNFGGFWRSTRSFTMNDTFGIDGGL